MYKEHPSLFVPQNNDKLWKYMSLPKFLNLLNGKLYFNRVDCFEDVFESTFPEYNELHRKDVYKDMPIPSKEVYDNIVEYSKKSTYVSCFHKNAYESAFMWKLYAEKDGVAIVTDVERLKMSFQNAKENIYISDVQYIDYENEFMPEGNAFYLSIYKRKSFVHENEVRCLLSISENSGKKGTLVDIVLNKLIEKVYISPYAPTYMKEDVEQILRSRGINVDVIYSPLLTIK